MLIKKSFFLVLLTIGATAFAFDPFVIGGVVSDEDGAPVSGARVVALHVLKDWVPGTWCGLPLTTAHGETTTGGDGRFTLDVVAPAKVGRNSLIFVHHPDSGGRLYELRSFEDEAARYASTQVPLNIVIYNGGDFTGRVLNEEGEPVVGAEVVGATWQHSRLFVRRAHYARSPEALLTYTDEKGEYRFPSVPKGVEGLVSIKHPDYGYVLVKNSDTPQSVPFFTYGAYSSAETILQEAGSITGYVRDSTTGRPIEGAEVYACVDAPAVIAAQVVPAAMGPHFVLTDASGRYELRNLGKYAFDIGVRHSDYLPDNTNNPVSVKPGATVEGPDFKLKLGSRVTVHLVYADTDEPVAGLMAYVNNDYLRPDGSVDILLKPGKNRIRVGFDKRGYWVDENELGREIEAYAGVKTPDITYKVHRPRMFRGNVVDERGNPMSATEVAFHNGDMTVIQYCAEMVGYTDEDGNFELPLLHNKSEALFLFASSPVWQDEVGLLSVIVPATGDVTGQIRVTKKATIRGRVVDAEGNPAAGGLAKLCIQLKASGADGKEVQRDWGVRLVTLGETGTFAFDAVPGQSYLVEAGLDIDGKMIITRSSNIQVSGSSTCELGTLTLPSVEAVPEEVVEEVSE